MSYLVPIHPNELARKCNSTLPSCCHYLDGESFVGLPAYQSNPQLASPQTLVFKFAIWNSTISAWPGHTVRRDVLEILSTL